MRAPQHRSSYRATSNGNYYIATHDNPGYDPTISTWFWSPYTNGGSSSGGGGTGGSTGGSTTSGMGGVVSSSTFDQMFPNRSSFYSYSGLTNAGSAFSEFVNSTDSTIRKREAAAFLANVAWESDQLRAVREYDTSNYCNYCDASQSYGCPAGQCSYYGRGPLQLSWNFNYRAAGSYIGVDLLNSPDKVATDATIAWKTAMWFWNDGPGRELRHRAHRHHLHELVVRIRPDDLKPQRELRVRRQEFGGGAGASQLLQALLRHARGQLWQ